MRKNSIFLYVRILVLSACIPFLFCDCSVTKNLSSEQYVRKVTYENQSIDLPGVSNARQLGGYVIGGKKIRKDVLLRTGNLGNASEQAASTLENKYHLAFIFDLRASLERNARPDKDVNGCRNIWLPCLEEMIRGLKSKGAKVDFSTIDNPYLLDSLISVYSANDSLVAVAYSLFPAIASDRVIQKNVAEVLDSLSVLPEGRAALWHCSHGKDRCGFTSAMVLAALGADKDLIVKDFALSNHGYQKKIDSVLTIAEKRGCSEVNKNMIYNILGVNADAFSKMLDGIEKEYGSIDNYLTVALDCPEGQRKNLREKFLEKL